MELPKSVYMLQPTELEQGEHNQLVCEVTKSLDDLTTAAIWYSALGEHLKEIGFPYGDES